MATVTLHPAAARRLDDLRSQLPSTGWPEQSRSEVVSALILYCATLPQIRGALPFYGQARARGELDG